MQARKKRSTKAYSGFMLFPLLGAETYEDFRRDCRFAGDFCDFEKRKKIFKKNRRFIVEISVRHKDFFQVEEIETSAASLEQLCNVLMYHTKQILKDKDGCGFVDYLSSYYKIRVK